MDLLFWIYLINATILINHEIDSAYWHEWNLFKPIKRFGINGFLILHFPFLIILLLGLVKIYDHNYIGNYYSLFLSFCGLFAFFFHFYHIIKGKPEFNSFLSKSMIIVMFLLSVFQMVLTIKQMIV